MAWDAPCSCTGIANPLDAVHLLNTDPIRSPCRAAVEAKRRGMEGTWFQLLRSCALHLLHGPRFQDNEKVSRKSEGKPKEVRRQRWGKVGGD